MNNPPDDRFKAGVLKWHQWLTGEKPKTGEEPESAPDTEAPPPRKRRQDTSAWPAMRRCRTVADALLAPPFPYFVRCVLPDETERTAFIGSPRNLARLARAAIAVGHVETADTRVSFPHQMAADNRGRPRVSRAVAHGLFNTEDPDEALHHTLQIVGILNRSVNIADLARGMAWWPGSRTEWAYRYNDEILANGR